MLGLFLLVIPSLPGGPCERFTPHPHARARTHSCRSSAAPGRCGMRAGQGSGRRRSFRSDPWSPVHLGRVVRGTEDPEGAVWEGLGRVGGTPARLAQPGPCPQPPSLHPDPPPPPSDCPTAGLSGAQASQGGVRPGGGPGRPAGPPGVTEAAPKGKGSLVSACVQSQGTTTGRD